MVIAKPLCILNQCMRPWTLLHMRANGAVSLEHQGLFQQFWEKAAGQNWEKIIDLTSKLGEINDIKHNKGSNIYPQNQVILHCIM